jgi:hypothetical protein
MKTMNSLSGGKTSSFLAVHYPADFNVFALVRTEDKSCMFPDAKLRQVVSDKIGTEFIGTLEHDEIIYTMLDLEQFIGKKINWVTGKTFDKIIVRGEKKYLPNQMQRFCTVEMKIEPIKKFWFDNIQEPVETRIGFRANEIRRRNNMIERAEKDGFIYDKFIVGKHKNGNNKWEKMKYQQPVFPLIDEQIMKDTIDNFWIDKPVRFAYLNNCIGCFHRNPVLLNYMSKKEPEKFEWFARQERETNYLTCDNSGFKNGITYDKIKSYKFSQSLFDDDFNECDSGYCGL